MIRAALELYRQKGLAIGSDIGIISYQDAPLKEYRRGTIRNFMDFRQIVWRS
jgi:DNA-binding LacI/PurR family transcriptional regulator